jgi:hypothetical protein
MRARQERDKDGEKCPQKAETEKRSCSGESEGRKWVATDAYGVFLCVCVTTFWAGKRETIILVCLPRRTKEVCSPGTKIARSLVTN